jgi:hypothetical protein
MISNNYFSVKLIEDAVKRKGFVWFDNGQYNANIIGVRTREHTASNSFDDYLLYIAKDENNDWFFKKYPVTTVPGLTQFQNPDHKDGVAILESNQQYRAAYKLGFHKGQYKALVQHGKNPVTVYRDNTKDSVINLDPTTKTTGWFGINIHKSGNDSTFVGDWSAGCQVFKREKDFNEFIQLCEKSAKIYGNFFTYTLLDDSTLKL